MLLPMHTELDLTASEREVLGRAALDWVLRWFDRSAERPLYPAVTADGVARALAAALPIEPHDPLDVLRVFASDIAGASRDNGHPRMFGYVMSSGAYVGAIADFLASALNQNVTSWRSSPGGTTIERQVIAWIREIVGFPDAGEGYLVGGGSMANFVGLAAALSAAAPDAGEHGVRALAGEPMIYASELVHMSIPRAAAMLGLGRSAVRRIPVDADCRMHLPSLDEAIREDRAAGRLPVCVVVNAGDVNTGAVDPIDGAADVCGRHGVWLHADGAYGGFAMLAPSGHAPLQGLGRADSVSLDPHKWLYVPVDAGCVLVRDADALRRAFSLSAGYVDIIARAETSAFAFWDYSPELSRRFRALKVWMVLCCHGTRALGALIERDIAHARQLAAAIDASDVFERLAPCSLSTVCFRYVPRGRQLSAADLDALNRAIVLDVQHGGLAYLSNTILGGRFALRACILNHRTTDGDMPRLLEIIEEAGERLLPP
jgi:aromatic-L-amino-acid/L-tryptophan decarboxylase